MTSKPTIVKQKSKATIDRDAMFDMYLTDSIRKPTTSKNKKRALGKSHPSISHHKTTNSHPHLNNHASNTGLSFNEITRLTSLVDSLKMKVREYEEERKSFKIVARRQHLALQKLERENAAMPKVVAHLQEEVRMVKEANCEYQLKLMSAEKSSKAHIDETLRLQDKLGRLTGLLRMKGVEEGEALRAMVASLHEKIEERENEIMELNRALSHIEHERSMDLRELRHKNAALTKEAEKLRSTVERLTLTLEEKNRKISSLSVYSHYQQHLKPSDPSQTMQTRKPKTPYKPDLKQISNNPAQHDNSEIHRLPEKPELRTEYSTTDFEDTALLAEISKVASEMQTAITESPRERPKSQASDEEGEETHAEREEREKRELEAISPQTIYKPELFKLKHPDEVS